MRSWRRRREGLDLEAELRANRPEPSRELRRGRGAARAEQVEVRLDERLALVEATERGQGLHRRFDRRAGFLGPPLSEERASQGRERGRAPRRRRLQEIHGQRGLALGGRVVAGPVADDRQVDARAPLEAAIGVGQAGVRILSWREVR